MRSHFEVPGVSTLTSPGGHNSSHNIQLLTSQPGLYKSDLLEEAKPPQVQSLPSERAGERNGWLEAAGMRKTVTTFRACTILSNCFQHHPHTPTESSSMITPAVCAACVTSCRKRRAWSASASVLRQLSQGQGVGVTQLPCNHYSADIKPKTLRERHQIQCNMEIQSSKTSISTQDSFMREQPLLWAGFNEEDARCKSRK